MKEENGIIHGYGQLQYASRRIGHEGNSSEHQICSPVYQDRHSDGYHKQHRFKPGVSGQNKNQENNGYSQKHNLLHLYGGIYRSQNRGHRSARHTVFFSDNLPYRRYHAVLLFLIDSYAEQCVSVFVPILHSLLFRQFQRFINIHRIIQPVDLFHAVHIRYLFFIRKRLGNGNFIYQHPHIRHGLAVFLIHHLKCPGGSGIVSQIIGKIIIHAHQTGKHRTQDSCQNEYTYDKLLMFQ